MLNRSDENIWSDISSCRGQPYLTFISAAIPQRGSNALNDLSGGAGEVTRASGGYER